MAYLLHYPITRSAIKYHEAVATVLSVHRTPVEIEAGFGWRVPVFGM